MQTNLTLIEVIIDSLARKTSYSDLLKQVRYKVACNENEFDQALQFTIDSKQIVEIVPSVHSRQFFEPLYFNPNLDSNANQIEITETPSKPPTPDEIADFIIELVINKSMNYSNILSEISYKYPLDRIQSQIVRKIVLQLNDEGKIKIYYKRSSMFCCHHTAEVPKNSSLNPDLTPKIQVRSSLIKILESGSKFFDEIKAEIIHLHDNHHTLSNSYLRHTLRDLRNEGIVTVFQEKFDQNRFLNKYSLKK